MAAAIYYFRHSIKIILSIRNHVKIQKKNYEECTTRNTRYIYQNRNTTFTTLHKFFRSPYFTE